MCVIKLRWKNTKIKEIKHHFGGHSAPLVLQKCWKNRGGIPFDLGAFRGYICFRASLTSSSLNIRPSS